MKLKLAIRDKAVEEKYSISELKEDDSLEALLEFGRNYANSSDGNPAWQEGEVVQLILDIPSTHFLLLPSDSYLFIEN